ncbi:MAG: hypothetical protein JW788_07100 [Candidatus Omnitrophica bacterium]|nr:hypothetical protein [Candidatus Omnitrophota bacterium]
MTLLFIDIESFPYPHQVAEVLKMLLAGMLFFCAGYYWPFSKLFSHRLPLKNFTISTNQLARLPIKLYLTVWILRCLAYTPLSCIIQPFAGWSIMNIFSITAVYASLMIDTYLYFSPGLSLKKSYRKKILVRGLFFLTAELVYIFFILSMTGIMATVFLHVIVVYIKCRKKIPYVIILFVFMSIFIVRPFLTAYRSYHWFGKNIKTSFEYAVESISDKDIRDYNRAVTAKRFANPLYVAVLSWGLAEEGRRVETYKGVAGYIAKFIPRILWPDKPSVSYNRIGRDLGILGAGERVTSVGVPLLAGYVMMGGFEAICIGMFLTGILLKTYWEWLIIRSGDNFLCFVVYFTILFPWLMMGMEWGGILHANVSFLVYTYFLLKFIKKEKRVSSL